MRQTLTATTVLASLLSLALGCAPGGGGPAAAPSGATTSPGGGAPASGGGGGAAVAPCAADPTSFECEALDLINAARAMQSPALPPFSWNGELAAAARFHNDVMAANDCFAHVCSGEPGVGERISASGYAWTTYGETCGAGYDSAAAMVDGWLNSPGHRAILLGGFADVGLSRVDCPSGCGYGVYWTADFGRGR